MSHDRGCPCGKERWEYKECTDPTCIRNPRIIQKREAEERRKTGREMG